MRGDLARNPSSRVLEESLHRGTSPGHSITKCLKGLLRGAASGWMTLATVHCRPGLLGRPVCRGLAPRGTARLRAGYWGSSGAEELDSG